MVTERPLALVVLHLPMLVAVAVLVIQPGVMGVLVAAVLVYIPAHQQQEQPTQVAAGEEVEVVPIMARLVVQA